MALSLAICALSDHFEKIFLYILKLQDVKFIPKFENQEAIFKYHSPGTPHVRILTRWTIHKFPNFFKLGILLRIIQTFHAFLFSEVLLLKMKIFVVYNRDVINVSWPITYGDEHFLQAKTVWPLTKAVLLEGQYSFAIAKFWKPSSQQNQNFFLKGKWCNLVLSRRLETHLT